jgi:type II secretory pathway component PulF
MAVFAFRALDANLATVRGTIVADTPRQARESLRARGLTIQAIADERSALGLGTWRWRWASRPAASVVSWVRELATLLAVGVPLLEAIDTTAKQYRGSFHNVLLMLRDRVASGASLAEAMRDHPAVFDALCLHLVEVGENAGTLESSLDRLAEFKERSLHLKNRVASALMYPAFVLLVGVMVSVFLMTFVVPNLLSALLEAGREPPLATRVVKAISDFLLSWWWLLLAAAGAVVLAARAVLLSERGRTAWHRLQLRVPILGEMLRKQTVSRIALVVSTLIRSGVVFDKAVRIAASTTPNRVFREALQRCEAAVVAGKDIAEALEETGAFPAPAVRVFAAGQQTGRLDEMLERLATDYDRQVAAVSQRLTTILEPVLIVLLAVVVGWVAFATIMPILEAGDVL